jgi:hypothetical protein
MYQVGPPGRGTDKNKKKGTEKLEGPAPSDASPILSLLICQSYWRCPGDKQCQKNYRELVESVVPVVE